MPMFMKNKVLINFLSLQFFSHLIKVAVSDDQSNISTISIPVLLKNVHHEEEATFVYQLERNNTNTLLEEEVMKFCLKYSISKNYCVVLMERALSILENSNLIYDGIFVHHVHNHFTRSIESIRSERINKFRAEYTLDLKEENDEEIEKDIDNYIYNYYLSRSVTLPEYDFNHFVCFIHSCTLPNLNGSAILENILELIHQTQLYSKLRMIVVFNYGLEITSLSNLQILYPHIVFIQRSSDTTHFEIPSLRHMQHFAYRLFLEEQNMNHTLSSSSTSTSTSTHILYLHTKGASFNPYYQPVKDWRDMMLYFLVEKHHGCMHLLCSGEIDTVGCNMILIKRRHYSGNMWWATSAYLASLPELSNTALKYAAEDWLLGSQVNGVGVRAFCMHSSFTDHYLQLYPRERYASTSTTVKERFHSQGCSRQEEIIIATKIL